MASEEAELDPDLIGIVTRGGTFRCLDCYDGKRAELGKDLADEEGCTVVLVTDSWRADVGCCVDCGAWAADMKRRTR